MNANRCGLLWLDGAQALETKAAARILQADGPVPGDALDTGFHPRAGHWYLCNPRLRYEWCAEARWAPEDELHRTFKIRSNGIAQYIEAIRTQRAKAGLKGF